MHMEIFPTPMKQRHFLVTIDVHTLHNRLRRSRLKLTQRIRPKLDDWRGTTSSYAAFDAAAPVENARSNGNIRRNDESPVGEPHEFFIDIPDPCHVITDDDFAASMDAQLVPDLRDHFDQRFATPLATTSDRFCWDYWHVPGQYSLLRTPADSFFPPELYDRLEDALCEWGERVLGCRGISPVWLSYYVDGCRQELHIDSPHGPWAFVLSLTDWESRRFTGGETMLLQPHVLDFWRSFDPSQGMETPQLMSLLEPQFGRLTVFDPRLPHGVRCIEGTRDPRHARIVLHGWFTPPSPFFSGSLDEETAAPILNEALQDCYGALAEMPAAVGTATVKVSIGSDGRASGVEYLTNTLMPRPQCGVEDLGEARTHILGCIADHLFSLEFPPDAMVGVDSGDASPEIEDSSNAFVRKPAFIILPFVFE